MTERRTKRLSRAKVFLRAAMRDFVSKANGPRRITWTSRKRFLAGTGRAPLGDFGGRNSGKRFAGSDHGPVVVPLGPPKPIPLVSISSNRRFDGRTGKLAGGEDALGSK